jgi:transposase
MTGGERHDMGGAEQLLSELRPRYVIAEKAYDSDDLRDRVRKAGGNPVIPSRRGHRRRRHDPDLYKLRNRVERFVNRIKQCRRVETRYEKLACTFLGFVQVASLLTLI